MRTEELTNMLLQVLGVAWLVKVGTHFAYNQYLEKSSQAAQLFAFMLNRRNLIRMVHAVIPVFFDTPTVSANQARRLRNVIRISVTVFWLSWIITIVIALNDRAKSIQNLNGTAKEIKVDAEPVDIRK